MIGECTPCMSKDHFNNFKKSNLIQSHTVSEKFEFNELSEG